MLGSKRSDEEWQSLFDDFEGSGESAAAFCRERGLPAPYFRTKYRQRSNQGGSVAFAKVQVVAPPGAVNISIGEVQIRCDASVPNDWLAALIRQVQA
mgnify:FL=1